jgi:hypothetical protein
MRPLEAAAVGIRSVAGLREQHTAATALLPFHEPMAIDTRHRTSSKDGNQRRPPTPRAAPSASKRSPPQTAPRCPS